MHARSARAGSVIGFAVLAVVAVGLVPAGAVAAAPVPGVAAKPAAAQPRAVSLHSKYETATRVISRDGGASVALPDGHDLWLFGDTAVFRLGPHGLWRRAEFIDGSTSLLTRTTKGVVPSGSEVPSGVPKRFIPVPKGVYLPDGSGRPCTYKTAAFPARWPSGIAMLTKTEVIVTYAIVCVTTMSNGQAATRTEGWGYMLYNWKTHHIDQSPRDVFKPRKSGAALDRSKVFGSPLVKNGTVTMFSSQCTKTVSVSCGTGLVWSTSMKATTRALSNPASYKRVPLTTDLTGNWQPLSISVGRYGAGLRIVEMASIVGAYRIFTAPTIGANWHLAALGTLPGCPTKTGFCLALEGHPELSTAGKTFVSYKDADEGPGGHIVVSALPT